MPVVIQDDVYDGGRILFLFRNEEDAAIVAKSYPNYIREGDFWSVDFDDGLVQRTKDNLMQFCIMMTKDGEAFGSTVPYPEKDPVLKLEIRLNTNHGSKQHGLEFVRNWLLASSSEEAIRLTDILRRNLIETGTWKVGFEYNGSK